SGSPQMVRSMDGHGRVSANRPPPNGIDLPCASSRSADTPGNGTVALPGLVDVTPGSGVIMIAPVSVCHHVSTIGHRSWPMWMLYQIHASGLIGSPTEPNRRSCDRSWRAGRWSPHFMNARIAVGAV